MTIKKKVAIVTGAGSGIGRATAKRLAKDGFSIALVGRTKSKLEDVANEIGGKDLTIVTGDVSQQSDITNIIEQTSKAFKRIDVLINNAATFIGGTIDQITLEDWNRQFAVNTTGPFLLIQAVLPYLEETQGNIVNVSSVSGLGGDWGAFAYDATKGALNLMTQALALDFASKGVRINAVAPTLTNTDMAKFVIENKALIPSFTNRIAMGRPGQPDEIADTIAFLTSNDARFVTGTILPVDGGLTASNGQPRIS